MTNTLETEALIDMTPCGACGQPRASHIDRIDAALGRCSSWTPYILATPSPAPSVERREAIAYPLVEWAAKLATSIAEGKDASGVSEAMPNGKRYILMDWETYKHDVRISCERGQATTPARDLEADLAEAVKALKRISEGDVPRPVSKVYRRDGVASKHDQCSHDVWMYDDCGECIADFARATLNRLSREG